MTGPDAYYACQSGIWFTSAAMTGPWIGRGLGAVRRSTRSRPSSPLYNLTYVQVYDSTPTVVYVGYTPGYTGRDRLPTASSCTAPATDYTPWIGTVWYGPPVTYGYGVNMAYTPWTGWAFAFGVGCGFAMGAAMCGVRLGLLRMGLGRRVGRLVRPATAPARLGLRRRRGLGTGLRALVFGQRLQPVGLDARRDAQRRRIQRLDGQRLARPGGRRLQLEDRRRAPRASAARLQRLHRQLRLRRARGRDEHEDRERRPRAAAARSATRTPATPSRRAMARSPGPAATPIRAGRSTATTAASPRSTTTSTPTTTATSTGTTGNGWQKQVGGSGSTWQGASSSGALQEPRQLVLRPLDRRQPVGQLRLEQLGQPRLGRRRELGGGGRSWGGGGGWGGRSGGWGARRRLSPVTAGARGIR